ncbi:MAG: hypothetical protein OXU75_17390 [Deltaproteobacteria bacterium]|nr:hypothetical protein [Deltaproteobacteria bacterium]
MPVLLNNCRRRDHFALYGPDAFYDLHSTGQHATMLRQLRAGDECVVATPACDNCIIFNWFAFRYEKEIPDENGVKFRVFFGQYLRSEGLDKIKATKTEPYGNFFDIIGRFKQRSVIEQ